MSTTVFASEPESESGSTPFYFDNNEYEQLTLHESGMKKLIEQGHSSQLINSMPMSTIEKIGTSLDGRQVISYYTEVVEDGAKPFLQEVSLTDFNSRESELMAVAAENLAKTISVTDENGSIIAGANLELSPLITENVDGGTVIVTTTFYNVDSDILSHYLVVSEYQWSMPPSYRGNDYFGITRDNSTVVIPNSFGSMTYYAEQRYLYVASIGGVSSSLNSTNEYQNDSLPNEDSQSTGFAIKAILPNDLNPPPTMFVGTSFLSRNYGNMQGGVWYEGALKSPSIVPQNFNHWSTYLHQTSTSWGSVSLSIPFGASISITPAEKYSYPIVDTILVQWREIQ